MDRRSLVGYSPWVHKESDRTEVTWHACVHICMYLSIYLSLSLYLYVHTQRETEIETERVRNPTDSFSLGNSE